VREGVPPEERDPPQPSLGGRGYLQKKETLPNPPWKGGSNSGRNVLRHSKERTPPHPIPKGGSAEKMKENEWRCESYRITIRKHSFYLMKGIELESKSYHFRMRSDSFYFVIIILLCYVINII
jgi:hypothetical protein